MKKKNKVPFEPGRVSQGEMCVSNHLVGREGMAGQGGDLLKIVRKEPIW